MTLTVMKGIGGRAKQMCGKCRLNVLQTFNDVPPPCLCRGCSQSQCANSFRKTRWKTIWRRLWAAWKVLHLLSCQCTKGVFRVFFICLPSACLFILFVYLFFFAFSRFDCLFVCLPPAGLLKLLKSVWKLLQSSQPQPAFHLCTQKCQRKSFLWTLNKNPKTGCVRGYQSDFSGNVAAMTDEQDDQTERISALRLGTSCILIRGPEV